MPLQPPNLDNRDFESLVREARNRIPQYLPEWTDWNDSDPGITLLQLHAWLTETILYRLNQVPDLNYIKFLQMLGVEQRPAKPAQANLTFLLKPAKKIQVSEIFIPKGTLVGVSAQDLEEPLFFETDQTLTAISARLEKLVRLEADEVTIADLTQDNNTEGSHFLPFGDPATPKTSLLLGFSAELPFSRQEIGLQIDLTESGQALLSPPEVSQCGPEQVAADIPQLGWEYWNGLDWSELVVDTAGDKTRQFTQSGQVYFRVAAQMPSVVAPASVEQLVEQLKAEKAGLRYWLRVRFKAGSYAKAPQFDRILTNTVQATAAQTVFDEAVGSSNGNPNQVMKLRFFPVLAEPALELEVDEGSGFQTWKQVPDFYDQTPEAAVYLFNRNSGEITFGDGLRGRIPVAGQFNVIARHYRYGGGKSSNVGAKTIIELATAIPQVESVTNYRPATGGNAEEVLSDTKLRAARNLKSRSRAVTLEDFTELAKETPGALVARSTAYVASSVGGKQTIHVVIVPQSQDAKPVPSEVARQLVCRYLDERRLVTTQLQVQGPHYHDIDVVLDVRATDEADLKTVKTAIDTRLKQYFHPLQGGPDNQGWSFGRDIYYSELLREIMLLPGIRRVVRLQLSKLLPRIDAITHKAADPPYFSTQSEAQAAATALLEQERQAFLYLSSYPTAAIAEVTVSIPGVDEQAPPGERFQKRYYVAARYDCSDLPVADGALIALRQADISVAYDRGGAP